MDWRSTFRFHRLLYSVEDHSKIRSFLQTIRVLNDTLDLDISHGFAALDFNVVGTIRNTLQYKTGSNQLSTTLVSGGLSKRISLLDEFT